MLIETLSQLIPEKGELRLTLVREGSETRLAIIPRPQDIKQDGTDKELQARQSALISPIILRFDPKAEGIDQVLSEEIGGYVPHVAGATDRLAQYVADQKRLKEEADAAAKERAEKAKSSSKAKGKGKAADKGKVASKAADGEKQDKSDAPDLFSASVPAPEDKDKESPPKTETPQTDTPVQEESSSEPSVELAS